jgi:hypothetical protein
MLKALIAGLENTYQNQGVGGMASAIMVLEIMHTHYWDKEGSGSNKSEGSKPSSLVCTSLFLFLFVYKMYLIHSFNAMNLSDNLHEGYSVFNILGGD